MLESQRDSGPKPRIARLRVTLGGYPAKPPTRKDPSDVILRTLSDLRTKIHDENDHIGRSTCPCTTPILRHDSSVVNEDFSDAALMLIGHGSTVSVASSTPVYQHASALRQRNIFARVLEAFWKVKPGISETLAGVKERRVFIVPLFISEGYFTEQAIPGALGLRAENEKRFDRIQRRGDQMLHYCLPIGTHPSMTGVLLARANEVVEQHPFPRAPRPAEIALFIAGHGTTQNEDSRKSIEQQVNLIRSKNLYAEVYPVFLEEEPRIGDCYRMAEAKNIVMTPFFMSEGLHSAEEIPVLLGESEQNVRQRIQNGQPTWRNPMERQGKRVWYSASVGTEPLIADVILERVKEMARAA